VAQPVSGADQSDPKERLEKLAEAFADRRRVAIMSHDNPDPDALASAFALRAVLEHVNELEDCNVVYSGLVGRAENRAMIRELGLDPIRLEKVDLADFDAVALVDTQPGSGNNSLPTDRCADAVIDHHPQRSELAGVRFVDVREGYGATASILHEYVQAAGVPLPAPLITALFYAIKSETQELAREAGYADREAYLSLLPRADRAAIASIQRARVPRAYFRAFQIAIDNARIYGRVVLSDLQRVASPDMVAEIADFLLRLRGTHWAACMGHFEDTLVLSLRTNDPEAHAGEVIRRVVAGAGRAGGHGMMAGGKVPLGDAAYEDLAELVRGRLLDEFDAGNRDGEPLVSE
jgi:nanoRNase/pAp phosphatase (c-di-AMP/oligoRNAs hydrolase)